MFKPAPPFAFLPSSWASGRLADPRSRRRLALLWLMWVGAGAYTLALALHAAGLIPPWAGWMDRLVNDWLGLLTVWVPAAVAVLAATRLSHHRREAVLAAAALTAFAVGDTVYMLLSLDGGTPPFPSLADVGYLLVYPLLLVALISAVRRHTGSRVHWIWLDAAIGSLGAGAVLAVVLEPVLNSAITPDLATAVALATPLGDFVLVAAIVGITAAHDVELRGRWSPLAVGLLVFAAADVVYSLRVTAGTYAPGTLVDAGWAFGLALMAMWVDDLASGRPVTETASRQPAAWRAMTASSLATVAGLAVLIMSSLRPVPTLALWLAVAALLAAGARAQLTARLLERMAEQRLVAAATDELTGLPNRRALYGEAKARLTPAGAGRHALLMLDLDGFKEVNDSLGHHAGDQLLVRIGERLRDALRGDDLLVRLGGDEFAILLGDAGSDAARDAAARLAAAVAEPVSVVGTSLRVGASIGIALFPDDGPDLSVLLRKADIAMYKAKAARRPYHVYCLADDADGAGTLQLMQELRTALRDNQLVLHYQPKVDLTTGDVHGVEALVRWDHPARGLLPPDAFLNLVEGAGLMPALTRTVLSQALDQVACWRRDGYDLAVAVNLSASSLADPQLPEQIEEMLAARGLVPSALQLEITEEFLLGDRKLAQEILIRLRRHGIGISVDDFGTGYNTLAYLRELPIDELKIDSSFVIPMAQDARTAALVSATINLAHTLGMSIVAEGVETVGTYTQLSRMGCDRAQGYFMSRPIPADELAHWLATWRSRSSTAPVHAARTALASASSETGARP